MATKLTGSKYELPGGSRSTPSLNFNQVSSDANTGLYRPATDAIEFVTGGDAAILLDADGNVGIGMTYGVSPSTTSVDYRLDVSGDVNFRKVYPSFWICWSDKSSSYRNRLRCDLGKFRYCI